jgi:hypothetical protein
MPPIPAAPTRPAAPAGGPRHRPQWLLAVGAALGLAAAAGGLLSRSGTASRLPDEAAASVNERVVRRDELARALSALAADRRAPLGPEERRHVLDRLIEEELLVQRGLELGLAEHDRRVRADLVSAVVQAVVSEASVAEPSRAELEAFYQEHRDYFTTPGRLRVARVFVRAPGTSRDGEEGRAVEAARRLRAGEDTETVRSSLGDPEVAPLPDELLPPAKLREYIGPTALRVALELEPGGVSEPLRSPEGIQVIRLVEREAPSVPGLAEIEPEVRAELRRRAGDAALRGYLVELRERADVRLAPDLP